MGVCFFVYSRYFRILQSETYRVIDAIFYDKGLTGSGNHNDNWTKSHTFDLNRGEIYTTFSNTLNNTVNIKPNNDSWFDGDFCVEWHNYGTSNLNNYFILTGSSATAKAFGNTNLQINNDCLVKITVQGTTVTCSVDGESRTSYSINRSSEDKVKITMQINTGGSDIKFSNFKIYPI